MRTRNWLAILAATALAGPVFAQSGPTGPNPMNQSNGMPISPVARNTQTHGYMDGDLKVAPNRYRAEPKVLFTNPTFATALTKAMSQSGTPLPGTSLRMACAPFKSVGECVSALHAARELAVKDGFDLLRVAMTEGGKLNLADAIHQVAPDADAKKVASKAAGKARDNCELVQRSGY